MRSVKLAVILIVIQSFVFGAVCYPNLHHSTIRRLPRQANDTDNPNSIEAHFENLQKILSEAAKVIRHIIDVKEDAAANVEPAIRNMQNIVDGIAESKVIENTAQAAISALKTTGEFVSAASEAGEMVAPIIDQVSTVVENVATPLMKLAMCTLICPLRDADEKVECKKEHCVNPPKI